MDKRLFNGAVFSVAIAALLFAAIASIQAAPNSGIPCDARCLATDNGSGTANLPADCPFSAPNAAMLISSGLPVGTTVQIRPVWRDFSGTVHSPGGTLGGDFSTFNGMLLFEMAGTGTLAGYNRIIDLPTTGRIDNAPRGVGPLQSFNSDLQFLQGQVVGDPDFDLLRITAGTAFGMPSPGHTTLTQSGVLWQVDSFFDINYRIDFVGRTGSPFGGMSGSTTATIRLTTVNDFWQPGDDHAMHYPQLPDPAGWDVYNVNPRVLADDWKCITAGDVKDIHFWGSWLNDNEGVITSFDITIYSDVPAGIDLPYSHPGIALWSRNVNNFCDRTIIPGMLEGWYDPYLGVIASGNHQKYHQYDIDLASPDWFAQSTGTIYWLAIKANLVDPISTHWGWKSSWQHYNDDACWQVPPVSICSAPDNGVGSADLPANCPYVNTIGTFDIISGLPAGAQINSQGTLQNFFGVTRAPGGILGGEVDQFQAFLTFQMVGTGVLSGFNRTANIPIAPSQMHHGPRIPFTPLQTFPSEMFQMQGQLPFGDPDFDLLRITAGTAFGMPSPGNTTLTQTGSNWNVDSFFDINYRIDFIGAPGGPLAGRSGSTVGTVRIQQGGPISAGSWIDLYEPSAFTQSMDLAFVITSGSGICDCLPGDTDGNLIVNISDAVRVINYIFAGGPASIPYALCSGDANCDCLITISDVVYIVNYIFAGGAAPCDCTQWLINCGPPLR